MTDLAELKISTAGYEASGTRSMKVMMDGALTRIPTGAFNEADILAITQAICLSRKREAIDGPLFIGFDTHALSKPAFVTALEVLAANQIEVMVDAGDGYTPTPVVSHAVLQYNRGRRRGLACYTRVDAAATAEQKSRLERLSADAVTAPTLAGEPIVAKLTKAPGNDAPIGGLKVVAASGWFAARPSGTEPIYKIYAESFRDRQHLETIVREAQKIVNEALEEKR